MSKPGAMDALHRNVNSDFEEKSSVLRRLAVVSLLATFVSCGLTSCGGDDSDKGSGSCNEANKPSADCTCKTDGTWDCGEEDLCANANCGEGTHCETATGDCVPDTGNEKECTGSKPEGAKSCDCDKTNGQWKNCKYDCKAADKTDDQCQCDETTGQWKNCGSGGEKCTENETKCGTDTDANKLFTCTSDKVFDEGIDCTTSNSHKVCGDKESVKACICDAANFWVANSDSCVCDATKHLTESSGNCVCNETEHYYGTPGECKQCTAERPDPDCTCTDNGWNCSTKCTGNKPACTCENNGGNWGWNCQCTANGNDNETNCTCTDGAWTNCDYCKDKSPTTHQLCDSATGNLTDVKLIVTIDNNNISENGGVAKIIVKLNTDPKDNVAINLAADNNTGITITKPVAEVLSTNNWETGLEYTITTTDNNTMNDTQTFNFTITSSVNSATGPFHNLSDDSISLTVTDDDVPSIILNCDHTVTTVNNASSFPNEASTSNARILAQYGWDDIDKNQFGYGKVTCTVELGSKPETDVNVTISGTEDANGIIKTKATNESGNSLVHNEYFKTATLTFRKDDFDTNHSKTVVLKFNSIYTKMYTVDSFNSSTPFNYTFTALSETSGYEVSEVSADIKVLPMPRFIEIRPSTSEFKGKAKFNLPAGKYRLHAWGASGGKSSDPNMALDETHKFKCNNHGGTGAYIHGDLTLEARDTIYVRVGQAGSRSDTNAYNGGGKGYCETSTSCTGTGGGGGTDFCMGSDDCGNDNNHWPYRILVAGGGGGAANSNTCGTGDQYHPAGSAKYYIAGESGYPSGIAFGGPSVIIAAMASTQAKKDFYNSIFGKGQDALPKANSGHNGGAGGGWYGGYFDEDTSTGDNVSAGGGSSWAFQGTTPWNGHQDAKYTLTNVSGSKHYDTDPYPFFHRISIPGGENSNTDVAYSISTADDDPVEGNIGNGSAWIEVLYDLN